FRRTPGASRASITGSASRETERDARRREARRAAQVQVDRTRRAAALVDRPHDERLAAPAVARREHARHRRAEIAVRGTVIRALVERDAERLRHVRLRTEEAHRE